MLKSIKLCRTYSSFNTAEFTSGFTSTINTGIPVKGPLGKAGYLHRGITPRSLKQYLDNFVISQTQAKRIISAAAYNHYLRIQALRHKDSDDTEVSGGSSAYYRHPVEDEYPGQQKTTYVRHDQEIGQERQPEPDFVELQKSNCLIIGNSGTGKTLIAKTLAKILDVPFSISDCTAFTQAGYVGEDVDVCVQRLLSSCNWDVRRAETGIICLDEVDKIASTKMVSHGRDVGGVGVQNALLKLLEGTTLQITSPRGKQTPAYQSGGTSNVQGSNSGSPFQTFGSFGTTGSTNNGKSEVYTIDTSNILFILCGAFNGLSKIIQDRISKHSIGFNAPIRTHHQKSGAVSSETKKRLEQLYGPYFVSKDDSRGISGIVNALQFTEPKDLIAFGFSPEMCGRIPVIAALDAFDEETLVRVLREPRNSLLKQYEHLFKLSGAELKFTSMALREVAKIASTMNTGARGLRSILERLLSDAMFEVPGSSIKYVLVNSLAAKFQQPPVYFARGQEDRFLNMFNTEEAEWTSESDIPPTDPKKEAVSHNSDDSDIEDSQFAATV